MHHAGTPAEVAIYQVEPHVVAADVYGVDRMWAAAGCFYRVALESILGFSVADGRTLVLEPRIPASWPGFTLRYRLPRVTCYHITVVNEASAQGIVAAATLDGAALIPERGKIARSPGERRGSARAARQLR